MTIKLTKHMLATRSARMTSGPGEAWFYISPGGLEVCVATRAGTASDNCFVISAQQMRRALEVIDLAKREQSNGSI